MKTTLLLSATCALALTSGLAAAQDKGVPIGHIADLTGATASIGKAYAEGVADALKYVNSTGGTKLAHETVDYAYDAPRAVATYRRWMSSLKPVAIQGWGTADTEALVDTVTKDQVPYFSASYSGALTDPNKKGPKSTKAAPYNFFYGPSYSDACRALAQWSAEDWKKKGGQGKPKWVHMGANHPYPNAPKVACSEYAQELGFDVAEPITYSMGPGDFTAQCLTLKELGVNYAYVANIAGSTTALLNACQTVGAKVQFVANVWGYDENVMKAAGQAADGVVVAVRTGSIWTDNNPGMETVRKISAMSDPSGKTYRQLSYITGICSAAYMAEAVDWAAKNGGITGPNIKQAMYQTANWVPKGLEGVCLPSTWTPDDHRGLLRVMIYQGKVTGPTDAKDVSTLMSDGTMSLNKVAEIELPRRAEWIGY